MKSEPTGENVPCHVPPGGLLKSSEVICSRQRIDAVWVFCSANPSGNTKEAAGQIALSVCPFRRQSGRRMTKPEDIDSDP